MAEWLVRETQNLVIALGRRSNPRTSRIFANSRSISIFFLLHLLEWLFVVSVSDFVLILGVIFPTPSLFSIIFFRFTGPLV